MFTHDNSPSANVATKNLCRLQFTLPTNMKAPVFMYYKRESKLENGSNDRCYRQKNQL